MVVVGDLEIKIVWADTKEPFLEHQKDGATYIEVEPDAEYFVAIKRISMNGPALISCYVEVDGKDLGWNTWFDAITSFNNVGLREGPTNNRHHRCLRFVKPKIKDNAEGKAMGYAPQAYVPLIGKIIVRVYEAEREIMPSNSTIPSGPNPVLKATLATDHSMAPQQKIASKLKYVRSSTGGVSRANIASNYKFSKVRQIDQVVLNYATMPGLIKAGLFPPITASSPTSQNTADNASEDEEDHSQAENTGLDSKRAASFVTPSPVASQESPSNKRQKTTGAVRQLDLSQDD